MATTIDPATESAALDAVNAAIAIGIIVMAAVNGSNNITLQVVNPNLFTLAAQYYGDATQWKTIAAANGIYDPMPIGQFNLTIPQLPS